MDCPSSKYILDEDNFCLKDMLFTRGAQGEKGCPGNPGEIIGVRENVGCTGGDSSQQNIVIQPINPLSVPENIVIRTFGANDIYGNFIRDDSLTSVKGVIRGSGAIDLSVKREQCSQVASGDFSVIGGGSENTASGEYSIVGGGKGNTAGSSFSVVSGGLNNLIQEGATGNFIGGGEGNRILVVQGETGTEGITDSYNAIVGGKNNLIKSDFYDEYPDYACEACFIGSGEFNRIKNGRFNVITGGLSNVIDDLGLESDMRANFIGGGEGNNIKQNGYYNVIGGGNDNNIDLPNRCVIAGGNNNSIVTFQASDSVIVGGRDNLINFGLGFIGGGSNNKIDGSITQRGQFSFIGSGYCNEINSDVSVICGGEAQKIRGGLANFIGGGTFNEISDNCIQCVITGGYSNKIYDGSISGGFLESVTIGGGLFNNNTSKGSVIGGGNQNEIYTTNDSRDDSGYNTIAGGSNNQMNRLGGGNIQSFNTIGGGGDNKINTRGAGITIAGGSNNKTTNEGDFPFAVISGGRSNSFDINSFINDSVISGGSNNRVGPGVGNFNGFSNFTIAGGANNIGTGNNGVISGGRENLIDYFNNVDAPNNVISGGSNNLIRMGDSCVISGGRSNTIRNPGISFPVGSAIGGGRDNLIEVRNDSFMAGLGLLLDNTDINSSTVFGQYNKNGPTTTTGGYGFTAYGSLTTISTNSSRIFMIGNGTDLGSRTNAFSVLQNGYALAQTGFITAGTNADFAEYMESKYLVDGSSTKIPLGTSVVMNDDGFIMPSDTIGLESKVPIGVISGNATLISNTALEEWSDKYLKKNGLPVLEEIVVEEEINQYEEIQVRTNNQGRQIRTKKPVYKIYDVVDKSGNVIESRKIQQKIKVPVYEKENVIRDVSEVVIKEVFDEDNSQIHLEETVIIKKINLSETVEIVDLSNNIIQTFDQPLTINKGVKKQWKPKLNPDYDPTKEYKSRPERPEWNLVGLIGQVHLLKSQRTNPNWIKIKDVNPEVELWLIK